MNVAVISDLHFGDPMCTMIDHTTLGPGEKYDAFVRRAGRGNDFLILLGDTCDFSITDYADAYQIAKAFFRLIQRDRIAKNIIYLAGNHDFDLWHTVEHQANIIHRVAEGRPARNFRWSVPGVIDDRVDSPARGFQLPGHMSVVDPDQPPQTRVFMDYITRDENGGGQPTNFYFAYPNLYFVTDRQSILFTHGHYLEQYWTVVGEWALKIAGADLDIGRRLDLWELVAINFPLCQFGCVGIGQAGPLTKLMREVRQEMKDRRWERMETYLRRIDDELDRRTPYRLFNPKEWGTDLASFVVRRRILKGMKKFKYARYSDRFIQKPTVLERFAAYFDCSRAEVERLNADHGLGLPAPTEVVFGHTHQPIPMGDPDAPTAVIDGGEAVRLYNTGGWLWRDDIPGYREFCGAEVITYRTGEGFVSHTID